MKTLIIIILYFNFGLSNYVSINELLIPNHIYANYTTYFVNLIQIYDKYHRMYHIDNNSEDVFDDTIRLLRKSGVRRAFSVYNYDEIKCVEQFVRPNAARVLHIIYTANPNYWQIFTQPYKVAYRDVIIFITTNTSDESKMLYRNAELVKLSGKSLLIEIVNSSTNGILLYQLCYYCGNLSRTLMPIFGQPSNRTLFPFNYQNLNNHLLHIVYTFNYPFVYCAESEQSTFKNIPVNVCTSFQGIESHMVKLISRKMNFKFKVYTLDSQNASFLNMLKSLSENTFDFAFGSISITLSRRKITQFTLSYNVEEYNLLYKVTLSLVEIFQKFFDPFSDQMFWLLFLTAQILLVMLLLVIQNLENRIERRKTLIECFWLLLQIQMEQSIPSTSSPTATASSSSPTTSISPTSFISPPPSHFTTSRSPPTTIPFYSFSKYTSALLLMWCLTCLVLCSAYKGVTLSTLLHPPKTEPQGLVELLEKGYGIAANYKSRDIVLDLLEGLPYEPNVYFDQTNCEVFSRTQSSKVAMLNEWSILQYQLKKYCPRLDIKKEETMRIARKPVRTAGHAWATQQGAPYRTALDYYLSLILSGGLYVKWSRDHTYSETDGVRPFRLSRATQQHMQEAPLPLQALYPLIMMYLLGVLLACVMFSSEVIFFYIRHKRQIKICRNSGSNS